MDFAPSRTPTSRNPEEYPVVIRRVGNYIRAINYEFNVEHFEELVVFSETEKLLHIAQCVAGVYLKIEQKIASFERAGRPCPIPRSSQEIFSPQLKDEISLKEASRLLGEKSHNVRRMADDGELTIRRTRKGHRRFSRSEIENLIKKDPVSR